MKEELLKQLVDVVEKTKDFTLEQAPDVVRQIVTYGRAMNTFCIAVSIVSVALGCWTVGKFKNREEAEYGDPSSGQIIWGIASVALFFTAVMTFSINIQMFFMSWFTPKLFVIKYLLDGIR
jgi:hypothetical protein